jgi:DNA repair exonuclease SbcCD ATPase subunit
MIRLKSFRCKALRSFVKETYIEFPESGFLLIKGLNPATGESSGSGKSTILIGIAYALDICPYPASKLQSWLTDEPLQVQLTLTTDEGEVVINRGKKNSIVMGGKTITSAKAISETLKGLFGISPETLRAITYRPQRSSGLFLSLTDSGKKEFLSKILNLEVIEGAVERAEGVVKELAPQIENKKGKLTLIASTIEGLSSQILPELVDVDGYKSQVVALDTEIKEISSKIKDLNAKAIEISRQEAANPEVQRLEQMLEAAKEFYKDAYAADKEKEQAFRVKQDGVRKVLAGIAYKETTKVSVVRDIDRTKRDLEKLMSGACPTCERTWEESKAKAETLQKVLLNLEAHLQTLTFTEDKAKLEAEAKEYFSADPMVSKLRDTQDDLEHKIRAKRVEVTQASSAKFTEEIGKLSTQKAVLGNELSNVQKQSLAAISQNKNTEQIRAQHAQNLKRAFENQEAMIKEVSDIELESNAEKDFIALMGRNGFLGVIFEEILSEIEDETNNRLSKLANVSHVTLRFDSEAVSQKGVARKAITPIASIGGHDGDLEASLSGGMFSSVEGVVDIALMSVIQRRVGTLPGWLFLDESWNGQGNVTKEAAMEVLREFSNDKLIVVIDHSSETKEFFSKIIEVRYSNGMSEVV